MGNTTTRTREFTWKDTEEPHATRRKEILTKYPEIKTLFGPDIRLLPSVTLLVASQLALAYYTKDLSWSLYILTAWVVGGTISHSLSLATHELSHGLCFETEFANDALGMIANCGQDIPSSVTFKKYHLEHHQRQGHDQIDVDIPTRLEAYLFESTLGKMIFIALQPLFYALRPVMVYPKPLSIKEVVNIMVVFLSNIMIYRNWSLASVGYLWLSDLLGLGIHPIAGHFIAEHYEFIANQETYSYYGPLNYLTFNVGYHNEHHDFPRISGFNLPLVRKMAPEYYDTLPQHPSWPMVVWNFCFDTSVSPFSRIKRFHISS